VYLPTYRRNAAESSWTVVAACKLWRIRRGAQFRLQTIGSDSSEGRGNLCKAGFTSVQVSVPVLRRKFGILIKSET
jgi:hypothetical protein